MKRNKTSSHPITNAAKKGYPGRSMPKTGDSLAVFIQDTIRDFHDTWSRPSGKTVHDIINALHQGVEDIYSVTTSISQEFAEELKTDNLY